MRIEPASFFSDGLRLSGTFYLPEQSGGDGPQPLVIPCSGFTGLNSIHPARFARFLTASGRTCFGFDYRGFGEFEGERGRVVLEEQVWDIRAAVAFAASDPRIDSERIILLGWGMGGGLVIDAARGLPGIIGLIAVNGFYNGRQVQRAHRGEAGLAEFERLVAHHAARRARTGEISRVDPFELYPLDQESREYVDTVLRLSPGYDTNGYSWHLAESLLRWNVKAYAADMTIPLLIAHGDRNALHPVSEAESLQQVYGGPTTLYRIEGAGHTEFMHDENPTFRALARRIDEWVGEVLETV